MKKKSQKSKSKGSVILSVKDLSKKYDQLEILRNIKFTLSSSEKVGLVGPNGSGKSTLLKIIAGIIEKDSGTIVVDKKSKIEYLPQFHNSDEKLSPGELAKQILVPIVSSDAEIFLLDEPTNNLDVEGLEMIENFISNSLKSFIIISHDREFLDRTVNRVIEIDPDVKTNFIYEGNYSDYAKERKAKIERQWKEYGDKLERIGKFNKNISDKISWMKEIEKQRLNNRNLPMHEKEKPYAAVLRDKEGKAGRRARIMKDRLDRYKEETEEIIRPKHLLPPKIEFEENRGSDKVFILNAVIKHIGTKKIGPLSSRIQYGDRLHIKGGNGAGKTTLLKMMIGEIQYDKGEIQKGENVRLGYISQERWTNKYNKKSNKKVIEQFLEETKMEEEGNARKILNRFRLTSEDINKEVSLLSPGEYSRLVIAELVAKQPNCIILDEPTNHLDLEILEELEKGLQEYKGTLIVVSHDRYFVERINLNKILVL
jgi:ATP-binding cassette, subfamily F, member 3